MFIYTAKLSKPKCIAVTAAAAVLILLAVTLVARLGRADTAETGARRLETPESRLAFLAGCGYDAVVEPVSVQDVRVPEEWNEAYRQYNALQKSQGFDLSRYKGKTLTQYVYEIANYPESNGDRVTATLLLYKNKLVGADLSRGGTDSFLRPLLGA